MVNAWIEHVKTYAKQHNIPYGCAIVKAKSSYKKVKDTVAKKKSYKEIQADRLEASKHARANSAALRKEVKSWFNSRTKTEPTNKDVSNVKSSSTDDYLLKNVYKKKSGVLL